MGGHFVILRPCEQCDLVNLKLEGMILFTRPIDINIDSSLRQHSLRSKSPAEIALPIDRCLGFLSHVLFFYKLHRSKHTAETLIRRGILHTFLAADVGPIASNIKESHCGPNTIAERANPERRSGGRPGRILRRIMIVSSSRPCRRAVGGDHNSSSTPTMGCGIGGGGPPRMLHIGQ